MLIWGSVTHQCSECMCVCHIAKYKDYNMCVFGVRTRERKEPADHLRDDISVLFHSSTEKGVSQEGKHIFSTFAQAHTHTLIHRCVGTDWAPVSESTWSVKDNPKGKQRANETLMSWSRISWSLLQLHLCTAFCLCSAHNPQTSPHPNKPIRKLHTSQTKSQGEIYRRSEDEGIFSFSVSGPALVFPNWSREIYLLCKAKDNWMIICNENI